MRTYQTHDIQSHYIDINNERIIILYDSKSAVNYINTNCELCLKALNRINIIEQNDEKMITILEYNNLSNITFRKRRNSANCLIISTVHLIKSSLDILKEDNENWKKKSWDHTRV